MNTLSWFLYLADILENLKVWLILFGVGSLFITFGLNIAKDFKVLHYLFIPVILMVLASFIPSKNTLYAVAASEIGETAVKSKLGQKISLVLENWIDTQLQDKPKVEQK